MASSVFGPSNKLPFRKLITFIGMSGLSQNSASNPASCKDDGSTIRVVAIYEKDSGALSSCFGSVQPCFLWASGE